MNYDVIIRDGLWFDGTGSRRKPARSAFATAWWPRWPAPPAPLDETGCPEVIDAAGKWIMPGFIDVHTHYDAEILLDPGLRESVRHGVTTVLLGNCSLSTVYANSEDAADLFSRVEAVPREFVYGALEANKTWSTPAEYIEAIDALPLGPNVGSLLGHSDLRTAVLGLDRATDAACPAHRCRTGEDGGVARRGARGRGARHVRDGRGRSTSSTATGSGRARCRRPSRRGGNGAG